MSQEYCVSGVKVCRETFMFCHSISKNKLAAIASSVDTDGLKPRIHKNTGELPKHALSMTDLNRYMREVSCLAMQMKMVYHW